MAGMADGIATGFGLMQSHYDRQDRKERLDKEDAHRAERERIADERYQQGLEYQQGRDKVADERYAKGLEYQHGRDKLADERYQQGLEYQQGRDKETDRRWNASFGLQQQQAAQAKRLNDVQLATAEEQRQNAAAVKVMQLWEAGQMPDEKGFNTLRAAGLDPDLLVDPTLPDSLTVADQVFTGGVAPNSPQALDAMNHVFKSQLSRGVGEVGANGKKITGKRVSAVLPGDGQKIPKDHVVFELEVTTEGGETYRAPLTMNRSADPKDSVKAIPIEMVARHLQGLKRLSAEPGLKKIYAAVGHKVDATGKWSRLSDNALYNQEDGTTKTVGGDVSKLTDREKEALKNLRSQHTALSRNVMPDDEEGQARLRSIEAEMDRILSASGDDTPRIDPNVMVDSDRRGESPSPENMRKQQSMYSEAQQSDLSMVLQANPGWDEGKAVAYLKYLGRW